MYVSLGYDFNVLGLSEVLELDPTGGVRSLSYLSFTLRWVLTMVLGGRCLLCLGGATNSANRVWFFQVSVKLFKIRSKGLYSGSASPKLAYAGWS